LGSAVISLDAINYNEWLRLRVGKINFQFQSLNKKKILKESKRLKI